MQSVFRCYHALTIARGLRERSRTLSHTRIPPFPTPALGVDTRLCGTHVLPDCQNRAWSHGIRTRALDLSKTGLGHRRPFSQSAFDSGPDQHMAVKKKDKVRPSDSASRQRYRLEETDPEGATKQRPETRTRDSPAQSSQRGR